MDAHETDQIWVSYFPSRGSIRGGPILDIFSKKMGLVRAIVGNGVHFLKIRDVPPVNLNFGGFWGFLGFLTKIGYF